MSGLRLKVGPQRFDGRHVRMDGLDFKLRIGVKHRLHRFSLGLIEQPVPGFQHKIDIALVLGVSGTRASSVVNDATTSSSEASDASCSSNPLLRPFSVTASMRTPPTLIYP